MSEGWERRGTGRRWGAIARCTAGLSVLLGAAMVVPLGCGAVRAESDSREESAADDATHEVGSAGEAGEIGEARQSLMSAQTCVSIRRLGASGSVSDTQIVGGSSPKTYGTSGTMNAGTFSGAERQALIQFDLSAIPSGPGINIVAADLGLTQGGLAPTGPGTVELHRITAPWSESTVTWQSFAGAYDPAVVASFPNSVLHPTLDIHALVASWVDGTAPNHGVLVTQPGASATNFWTSEYGDVNARPSLFVCYTTTCAPGTADCNANGADGCETNIAASAAHCGGCNQACSVPGGTGACVNGACTVGACSLGFADCDGNAANGCEASLTTNSDCGGCGVPCALANAAASCAGGTCTLVACNAGAFDCDGNPQNGCEALPCTDGSHCATGAGCQSGICAGGFCASPACSDHVQNGGETAVDCGGASCPPCADGLTCNSGRDCAGGVCAGGVCQAPTCADGVKNGHETAADCGGSCPPCADGEACAAGSDCDSGVCTAGVCQAPSCSDGILNGDEAGVDCGGACAVPEICGNGIDDDCNGQVDEGCGTAVPCTTNAQCPSGTCSGGVCAPGCGAGGFCPTASTTLCGTQTWSSVYIPAGVTVTCAPGCNSPVIMNVTGDVVIAGTLDLDGANGAAGAVSPGVPNGAAGGAGGVGRCGGSSGGNGGVSQQGAGSAGQGPGGGGGGTALYYFAFNTVFYNGGNGSGAGYGTAGIIGYQGGVTGLSNPPGGVWGNAQLTSLLGGSGGGGGSGGLGGSSYGFGGYGGGAGGGALKILAGGYIAIGSTGVLTANGGIGGTQNTGAWASGGAGSGGAIWLSAYTVTNLGLVQAKGGVNAALNGAPANAGKGGDGRIRVDSTMAAPSGSYQPAIGYAGSLCGQPCNTGLAGACGTGTTVCQNGAVTCTQTVFPTAETCDGVDNDCDGTVDNGNPGAGAACTTGLKGICGPGTTACVGGSLACVQNQQPQAETCDGLDNDCNGVVDNGNPGGGASCTTGLPGVCGAGTVTCTAGALSCAQNVQPTGEICDGLDNDCNGVVDNNCAAVITCSTSAQCPSGVCSGGVCAPSCPAGAFCPTAAATVCGSLSYTSVYIPSGVTVGCTPGCSTPVTMNVSGPVVIAGTLDFTGANGVAGQATGGSPGGANGGAGGVGKCGGSSGGAGGHSQSSSGSVGAGSGGGGAGNARLFSSGGITYYNAGNGSGAGYGTVGIIGWVGSSSQTGTSNAAGGVWGSAALATFLGGSGGGGGSGGLGGASTGFGGYGGGAGGGALKIVSTGYIAIGSTGLVKANGGIGGTQNSGAWGSGGAGSGGAIWLSSVSVTNLGSVQALGGVNSALNGAPANAGQGGAGRIRVDTNGAATPSGTFQPAIGLTGAYP